jgi:hypothetical protein
VRSYIRDLQGLDLGPSVQVSRAGAGRYVHPSHSEKLLPIILLYLFFVPQDPDLEDAPVVPDMGLIELRAFRTRAIRTLENLPDANYGLHGGRVSERSKKAGWHHVRYETFPKLPV